MAREVDLGDLKLIVRALHRDVSTLDDRLRRLESQLRELRESAARPAELIVIPSREKQLGA